MKYRLLLLLLTLTTVKLSFAADFELGVYELNRGQFKAALAELEPLAEEGFSPAQYQLGRMSKKGYGVIKNQQKSFELLTLAAKQKYADAQFDLAVMYSEGEVVEQDLIKAFLLTEKAANQDLASAQFNLGVMYYQGLGTIKDYYTASKWYRKAAEQNYALAQFNLALMYFDGKGLDKSIEMSYIWNTLASYNGYSDATTSRDMDAHRMSKAEVKKAQYQADDMYRIMEKKAEMKRQKASKKTLY